MSEKKSREPQYQSLIEKFDEKGLESLGLMTSQAWDDDPKRLAFTLARYKFVAKMLSGRRHVLEVGCADAFGTRVVRQEVKELTAVDFDPVFIEDVNRRMRPNWRCCSARAAKPIPSKWWPCWRAGGNCPNRARPSWRSLGGRRDIGQYADLGFFQSWGKAAPRALLWASLRGARQQSDVPAGAASRHRACNA